MTAKKRSGSFCISAGKKKVCRKGPLTQREIEDLEDTVERMLRSLKRNQAAKRRQR